MREKLQTLPLSELKEMAKSRGIKGISSLRKAEIIDLLCAEAEKNPEVKPAEIKREERRHPAARKRTVPRTSPMPLSATSQGARIIRKTGMTAEERITAALFQEGTTTNIHRTEPSLPSPMETVA